MLVVPSVVGPAYLFVGEEEREDAGPCLLAGVVADRDMIREAKVEALVVGLALLSRVLQVKADRVRTFVVSFLLS